MNNPTDRVGTRLLFENDRVRVWELALLPGESLETHVHRLDYVILVESGGLLHSADPDDPASGRDIQFHDNQVEFRQAGGGKIDNRLTNIGAKRHRNYVIELKQA